MVVKEEEQVDWVDVKLQQQAEVEGSHCMHLHSML